jgi:predicted glycogen debranching enzyme
VLDWGREIAGDPAIADRREWLTTNGIGGFASGTVSGILTRRYHGLLVAALSPPLGRTLLVARVEDRIVDEGAGYELSANLWADGAVAPRGFELIERFHLDGSVPVWTYACADLRIEKRVWMEHDANTTYLGYRLARGARAVTLEVRVLVDYRNYHAVTRGGNWWMAVAPVPGGIRVEAFEGAQPFFLFAEGADVQPVHDWYRGFRLPREEERGLEFLDDHLHAATFTTTLLPGADFTLVLSTEEDADIDGGAALRRRDARDRRLLADWRRASPLARQAPPYIRQLVLAADVFVVDGADRPMQREPTILAGYPWFADWSRDTMIALAGLTLATGRAEVARRLLTMYTRFVKGGLLPNRFVDTDEAPEYNTADAALWYIEAVRAYDAATKDDATLATLFPVLESIVSAYRTGTRYGIREDPADHLVAAGEPGVQLTWMDAKVGDRVVTPRAGKPVEINALWHNGLCAMRGFAARLGRATHEWDALAAATRLGFARFWNTPASCCFDVIDTPDGGVDPTIRPNQILAVSLAESPLNPEQQRAVVEVCGRRLLTSYGLRSLAADDPQYRGRYGGNALDRDAAYHQGAAWAWLLGPFALAHFRVHRDRAAALGLLDPIAHHLEDAGLGSVSEIFDGDPPHRAGGCPFQAWSVAEVLRAYTDIAR